jgi:hypothetical protein
MHFFDIAELEIRESFREIYENADDTMLAAAELPPGEFVIPERTPTDLRGKGQKPNQTGIKQFPGGPYEGKTEPLLTGQG